MSASTFQILLTSVKNQLSRPDSLLNHGLLNTSQLSEFMHSLVFNEMLITHNCIHATSQGKTKQIKSNFWKAIFQKRFTGFCLVHLKKLLRLQFKVKGRGQSSYSLLLQFS
uniref:Uncharacterized protein n=1 Tax=Micrurus spixii TaxID=129469 RepID=A0A2D4MBV3_9SAUR